MDIIHKSLDYKSTEIVTNISDLRDVDIESRNAAKGQREEELKTIKRNDLTLPDLNLSQKGFPITLAMPPSVESKDSRKTFVKSGSNELKLSKHDTVSFENDNSFEHKMTTIQ